MADAPEKTLTEGRKFKALLLAIAVYGTPICMTFVLVLLQQAVFADLKSMSTWMGVALSPAFMAFILGTAWEGAAAAGASKQGPQQAAGDIVNVLPTAPEVAK